MALPKRSNEDVLWAVVVVVTNGDAEAEDGNCESRFCSYIGERSVVIVVVKLGRGRGARMSRPVLPVDQQNVRPAVVVVINEPATGTHGLGQIFFSKGRVIVREMDSGLGSDVAEGDLSGGGEGDQ